MPKKNSFEEVTQMESPSTEFLSDFRDNKYAFQVIKFQTRDKITNKTYFEISKPIYENTQFIIEDSKLSPALMESLNKQRSLNYKFPLDFFLSKGIKTHCEFKNGDIEAKNIKLVENYFLNGKRIFQKVSDFGNCGVNEFGKWDNEYVFPEIEGKEETVKNGVPILSDSFIFIDGECIIHNKCSYRLNE